MTHAEPLLWRTALSDRHPARMSLSPEQHSRIAATYNRAAFDTSLPAHTRAAFAKKSDWFRLLAQVGEKKRAALGKQWPGTEPILSSLPKGISRASTRPDLNSEGSPERPKDRGRLERDLI